MVQTIKKIPQKSINLLPKVIWHGFMSIAVQVLNRYEERKTEP